MPLGWLIDGECFCPAHHFRRILSPFPLSIPAYAGNVIPLSEFKKLLGPAGENLSDEEILRIREVEDRLADIVFEMWLKHRRSPDSKVPR